MRSGHGLSLTQKVKAYLFFFLPAVEQHFSNFNVPVSLPGIWLKSRV